MEYQSCLTVRLFPFTGLGFRVWGMWAPRTNSLLPHLFLHIAYVHLCSATPPDTHPCPDPDASNVPDVLRQKYPRRCYVTHPPGEPVLFQKQPHSKSESKWFQTETPLRSRVLWEHPKRAGSPGGVTTPPRVAGVCREAFQARPERGPHSAKGGTRARQQEDGCGTHLYLLWHFEQRTKLTSGVQSWLPLLVCGPMRKNLEPAWGDTHVLFSG